MMKEESRQEPAAVAVLGAGVMGRALALNIEERGFPVAIWNRQTSLVERLIAANPGKRLVVARGFEELPGLLARPRRIILMVTAGPAVDSVLGALAPLLSAGDVVVDGGNSLFSDTERRERELSQRGVLFMGCGVSGGEEGARRGPSLMPGGDVRAYEHMRPIFEAITARTDSGPCVAHLGPGGAGHFVKTVHNGIEYGLLQLIAEVYDLLGRAGGLGAHVLAGTFALWNEGPLASFLVELASRVLEVRDSVTGAPLVDCILDRAGQKGTGRWTVSQAVELGVPVPTIAAAVDARVLSAMKEQRVAAAAVFPTPGLGRAPGGAAEGPERPALPTAELIRAARDALLASTVCSFAQGMNLIAAASAAHGWQVSLAEVARVWKGGCILRARLLDDIMRAYKRHPELPNLLVDPGLAATLREAAAGWRRSAALAMERGVPIPAIAASLAYFDTYRAERLPVNLIQAQRDAFGAHTYERNDRPGAVHTDWLGGGER